MNKKILGKYVFLCTIFVCLLNITFSNAADYDNDGIDDENEKTLAERFAPIFYFEKEEELFPVSVRYHLSNSNLNKSTGNTSILIDANPSMEELSQYNDVSENYYLDNRKGTIEDDGIIKDYRENMGSLGYTVYSHVFKRNNNTIIQYWMFYAFNKGTLNTHEGDWEMVQIILDEDGKPVKAMYSQHIGGQKAEWKQVERNGEHIKVYVARGSHANYFRYYQGMLGLARDVVGKNGRILVPGDYSLVILGEAGEENHETNQNWIDFAGRWGDFGGEEDELRGKRGPYGPVYRENGKMWNGMEWGDSLPALRNNVLKIEWLLYHFTTLYFIVLVASLAFILFSIYRRYKKGGLKKPFIHLLKIDGINMKSIGNILAIIGVALAIAALFYPWYDVSVNILEGKYKTPGWTEILSIDGMQGVQINLLEANSGMIQIGALPIPFSLIIGAAIIFFILGIIGIESKKAGKKYMMRGIKFLIPVILIIIGIMSLQILAFQIGEIEAAKDAKEIIKNISSHPIGGEDTLNLPDYGNVYLEWGLEKGAILLLLSSILLIISGLIELMVKENNPLPKNH